MINSLFLIISFMAFAVGLVGVFITFTSGHKETELLLAGVCFALGIICLAPQL